jgi:hypothetical protein
MRIFFDRPCINSTQEIVEESEVCLAHIYETADLRMQLVVPVDLICRRKYQLRTDIRQCTVVMEQDVQ